MYSISVFVRSKKVEIKAIEPEVNDLRGNLPLDVGIGSISAALSCLNKRA